MSYILDALRRAEADRERERGRVPGLHTQPLPGRAGPRAAGRRRWLPWAGGGLLLLAGLGAGSWWASGPQDAVAPAPPPAPAPLATAPAPEPVPSAPVATPPVASPPPPQRAAAESPYLAPAPPPGAGPAPPPVAAAKPAPPPAPAAEARIPRVAELARATIGRPVLVEDQPEATAALPFDQLLSDLRHALARVHAKA